MLTQPENSMLVKKLNFSTFSIRNTCSEIDRCFLEWHLSRSRTTHNESNRDPPSKLHEETKLLHLSDKTKTQLFHQQTKREVQWSKLIWIPGKKTLSEPHHIETWRTQSAKSTCKIPEKDKVFNRPLYHRLYLRDSTPCLYGRPKFLLSCYRD